jgi:hypothetical protein
MAGPAPGGSRPQRASLARAVVEATQDRAGSVNETLAPLASKALDVFDPRPRVRQKESMAKRTALPS